MAKIEGEEGSQEKYGKFDRCRIVKVGCKRRKRVGQYTWSPVQLSTQIQAVLLFTIVLSEVKVGWPRLLPHHIDERCMHRPIF